LNNNEYETPINSTGINLEDPFEGTELGGDGNFTPPKANINEEDEI